MPPARPQGECPEGQQLTHNPGGQRHQGHTSDFLILHQKSAAPVPGRSPDEALHATASNVPAAGARAIQRPGFR